MALLDKKFRNACKPIINSLERTPDIVNGRLCMGFKQNDTKDQGIKKYTKCVKTSH